MSMTDVFATIQKAIGTPPAEAHRSLPVFSAMVSDIEPGFVQLTVVSTLERADGRTKSAHLDVIVPVAGAMEVAFMLRRAANQLEDAAGGRPVPNPGSFARANQGAAS